MNCFFNTRPIRNSFNLMTFFNQLKTRILISFLIIAAPFAATYAADEDQILKAKNVLESKGEIYFMFAKPESGLHDLLTLISIDKVLDGNVYAYANKSTFL